MESMSANVSAMCQWTVLAMISRVWPKEHSFVKQK